MKETHILVVPNSAVGSDVLTTAYLPIEQDISEYLPLPCIHTGFRPVMEEDQSYRQVIPYVTIVRDGKMLAYQRPVKGNEDRLHGKWSVGVGGHVDAVDFKFTDDNDMAEQAAKRSGATLGMLNTVESLQNFDLMGTIICATSRELEEEIGYAIKPGDMNFNGFIVANTSDVDRVHLGLHCVIEIGAEVELTICPDSIENIAWVDNAELSDLGELEAWTAIVAAQ